MSNIIAPLHRRQIINCQNRPSSIVMNTGRKRELGTRDDWEDHFFALCWSNFTLNISWVSFVNQGTLYHACPWVILARSRKAIPLGCAAQLFFMPAIRCLLDTPSVDGCMTPWGRHVFRRKWPTMCIDAWMHACAVDGSFRPIDIKATYNSFPLSAPGICCDRQFQSFAEKETGNRFVPVTTGCYFKLTGVMPTKTATVPKIATVLLHKLGNAVEDSSIRATGQKSTNR